MCCGVCSACVAVRVAGHDVLCILVCVAVYVAMCVAVFVAVCVVVSVGARTPRVQCAL